MALYAVARTSRTTLGAIRCRTFTSTPCVSNDAIPVSNPGVPPAQKKPVGGVRGGIIGFLLGFSFASSYAAYHLLDEYQQASALLQASVDKLSQTTESFAAHARSVESVEKDLKALSAQTASKDDLSRVRGEVKKLYDGLHVEFLDLRTHVWGIQQDLHKLSKKESTELRNV